MAEDFYTMQEVMEKLRKSEQEVQDLVKQGKLRQYMDAGNAMFKTDDVNELAEEIVGLDVSSFGIDLAGSELELDLAETAEIQDLGGSELDLAETTPEPQDLGASELDLAETADIGDSAMELAETSEIELEPDEEEPTPAAPAADSDEIELKDQTSEGGFGLSQMGDLTMADTNVGTVGINILSGTEDAFKLTEDTKAETLSADAEELEELESLDADSNMESFGSGSGLLDLSLQADDTSLGAVLDDILPAGADEAGAGELPVDQIGAAEDDLLSEPALAAEPTAESAAPMAAAPTPAAGGGMPAQMVAVSPVDPRTNLFGIAMFLPLAAIIMVGIIMTAATKGVKPSLLNMLTDTEVAGVGLFWYVLGGMGVFAILFSLFASVGGGGGGATKTRTKKEKKPKAKKEKKPKAKKEKKPKKKKK